MIEMIKNTSLIRNKELQKIYLLYRGNKRSSQINMIEIILWFFEPIDASKNQLKLTIVPYELHQHIFN